MPILSIMRLFFFSLLILIAAGLYAAPLEGGYTLAPRTAASESEKAQAYVNARLRVIEAAKKYLGTPYRHGGANFSGVDCSGFVCASFQDALGVSLPRTVSGLYTWTVRTSIENAQPGDLLFFRTDSTNNFSHVGLYLGDRRFIHSASAGTNTGVIYSSLDEPYWTRAFAGAGRAFPEAPAEYFTENVSLINTQSGRQNSAGVQSNTGGQNTSAAGGSGRLLVGAAVAPIWNGFVQGGELMRGLSAQFYLYADTYTFGSRMVFGFELRPEYDNALNVFRIPITFSWGPDEKFRIFLGPVASFGDASLNQSGAKWLKAVGVMAAPFDIISKSGVYSPFIEASWQSDLFNYNNYNLANDFSAGFRFSTGVRWLLQVK